MVWYEIVNGPGLMQGDLVPDVQIPIIASSPETDEAGADPTTDLEFDVGIADVIVVSQSCDLAQKQLPSIIVAGVHSWVEVVKAAEYGVQTRRDNQKKIRMGRVMHYALLPKREDSPEIGWSVIDFRELYSLPTWYLEERAADVGDRLRLMSPYREEISQAFARYFMRVALPLTLEEFDKWDPDPVVAT